MRGCRWLVARGAYSRAGQVVELGRWSYVHRLSAASGWCLAAR